MDAEARNKLIEQYKDGYRIVAEALVGATDEELDGRPARGKWSAREVVHHLADSEMTAAIRARLLVAIDRPQIVGFDQDDLRAPLAELAGERTAARAGADDDDDVGVVGREPAAVSPRAHEGLSGSGSQSRSLKPRST